MTTTLPLCAGSGARTCNWNPHLRAVCQYSPLGHACFTSGGSGGCEGMVLLLWQFWWVFRVFDVASVVFGWAWDSKRQAVFHCRAGGSPPLPPAYQRPLCAFFTPSKQKTAVIPASVNFESVGKRAASNKNAVYHLHASTSNFTANYFFEMRIVAL